MKWQHITARMIGSRSIAKFLCGQSLTCEVLEQEAERYAETAGTSQNNTNLGFIPAFIDHATGVVYLSRFSNGHLAPCHLLEGLPRHLITAFDQNGKASAALASVTAGFCRNGYYYTRESAKREADGEHLDPCDLIFIKIVY